MGERGLREREEKAAQLLVDVVPDAQIGPQGVSGIRKERILMVILKEAWEGLGTITHRTVWKSPASATSFWS